MEELEIYLLSDQPTTCSKCGARTHFDEFGNKLTAYQVHACLRPECGFEFVALEE
jgi:hypothetical protein